MKLTIAAVGRMKSGAESDLVGHYTKQALRAGRKIGISSVGVVELPESRAATIRDRRAEEASALLRQVRPGALLVVLDESGRPLSSREFSSLLRNALNAGKGHMVFAIGGPDGHGDEIGKAADYLVSMGKMTWPHKLARAMVAEQVYRAVTILVNHPYHRE